MTEATTPKPPEVQIEDSVRYLRRKRYTEGVFLEGTDLINRNVDYPILSAIFPWAGKQGQKPDTFWIGTSTTEKDGLPKSRIWFSTRKLIGRSKIGVGIYRGTNVTVEYTDQGTYSAQLHTDTYEAGVKDEKTQVLYEGEATPPAIPDQGFIDVFNESVKLVKAWENHVKAHKDKSYYHGTENRTPRW